MTGITFSSRESKISKLVSLMSSLILNLSIKFNSKDRREMKFKKSLRLFSFLFHSLGDEKGRG